ncbi:MAG: hypothetical protein HQ582_31495 [Planctomycetes bacterium]|nr:hypothetical protein [Planctomycetota bacterium]
MNEQLLTDTPYLVVRPDGTPVCRDTEGVLSELKAGSMFVYDLKLAAENFAKLVGDKEEFSTLDLQELAGVSRMAIQAWRTARILQTNGKQQAAGTPHMHSRGQAFVSGVLGALLRQHIRKAALKPIADFLHKAVGEELTPTERIEDAAFCAN